MSVGRLSLRVMRQQRRSYNKAVLGVTPAVTTGLRHHVRRAKVLSALTRLAAN